MDDLDERVDQLERQIRFWRGLACGLSAVGFVVLGTRLIRARIGTSALSQGAVETPVTLTEAVYLSQAGTRYHRSSCRALGADCVETTRAEAEAQGREPCGVCRP